MSEAALSVDRLVVSYGTKRAVDHASFTAGYGAVTAIIGPNGAGKTSTLDVCTGVQEATSGTVRVLGQAPGQQASRVGTMLQSGGLYPTAKPLEWLQYLAKLYPAPADPRQCLEQVGIDPASKTTTRRLSGGEQQRVKLAAALLVKPVILFLDEPTVGLDPVARRSLLDTIAAMRAEGVAIVLTTHYLPDVEELADMVHVMSAGAIVASGTIGELIGTERSMQFRGPMHLDLASLMDALPSGYAVAETQPGRYAVTGEPTPATLAAITAWCAQHGVMATELRIGTGSLEELLTDEVGQ